METLNYCKTFQPEQEAYDVVAVGGGSAGICAAIAAARHGMKTLLIENTGWLGGIGTTAAMVEFGPIFRGGIKVVGGIPCELMQRMRDNGAAEVSGEEEGLYFAPESFAHTAMQMCEEAGVELLLHARFIDSIRDGNRIKGILVDTKERTMLISAKLFLDCSGDGDVFFKTGLSYELGRKQDGGVQPMTLVFFVNNVNYQMFLDHVAEQASGDRDAYFVKLVKQAKAEGSPFAFQCFADHTIKIQTGSLPFPSRVRVRRARSRVTGARTISPAVKCSSTEPISSGAAALTQRS